MFCKSVYITALTAFLAAPALAQNGVTCQTSDGSPAVKDVNGAIKDIKGRHNCAQTNGAASDCTTLISHNGGKIGVCGGTESSITCQQISQYAAEIVKDCQSGGKVGGTYTTNAADRIIVFT